MTPYKKLWGFGWSKSHTGIKKQLYEGGGHLLLVENFGLREDYSRIRFEDIRCLIVFEKPKAIGRFILGFILSALIVIASVPGMGVQSIVLIPIFLGLLIYNCFRRNCVCALGTDVQQIVIPFPNNIREVAPFVAYLRRKGAQVNPPI